MAFIRKIKRKDSIYLVKVENYREDGKVKQRVLEYVGKEENGRAIQKVDINKLEVNNVKHHADISILFQLCMRLNFNFLLGKNHKIIIALLIAHLVCKGSILKISKWIEHSNILQIVGLKELTLDMLYNALDDLNEIGRASCRERVCYPV